jgi:acetyltransferase-like isoleucine patch superfamily enzyme
MSSSKSSSRTLRNQCYSLYDVILIYLDIACSTLRARLSLWFQGCKAGSHFRSSGAIRIKTREAGSIQLGSHVTLLAGWRSNRVGLTGPVILHTWQGGHIEIGDYTGASSVVISSRSSIKIGKHCKIGGNVRIFDHDFHALDCEIRRNGETDADIKTRPILIGDDVFIGTNALILKGVTIGNGATIGAGSVVTKNIAPETKVVGNPAKLIQEQTN